MKEELEKLISMWDIDSEIDSTEPGRALIDIPKLHSKYLKILSNHRLLSKEAEYRLINTKKLRWEYYTGKLDDETLKKYEWHPFEFILKSEIGMYLDSDIYINDRKKTKIIHDEIVTVCESILKELNNRSFQIKTFVDWEKFINGGN